MADKKQYIMDGKEYKDKLYGIDDGLFEKVLKSKQDNGKEKI